MKDTVLKYIDILILIEIKLDETFLISQFLMDDFSKRCRFERNKYGGGLQVRFFLKKVLQTILNTFIRNLISENVSGYFVERIIRHLKIMSISLAILISPLTLTVTAKSFSLLEMSPQNEQRIN